MTGNDIKIRREALKLSQDELASLAGQVDGKAVTQQAVDRIERGLTKTSKYKEAILRALSDKEAGSGIQPVQPPSDALPPAEVKAALEVLLHILCKNDIAARVGAEALLSVLQAPGQLPIGADRQSLIRIETQRIAAEFARKVQ